MMAIECWNSAVMLTRVADSWRFQSTIVATNVAAYEFQRGDEGLGGWYSSSRYANRSWVKQATTAGPCSSETSQRCWGGGGREAGRKSSQARRFRKARYSRSTKSAPYLIPSVTSHNSMGFYSKTRVRMAENEPRPTRTQLFVWKPISKTIRITLENGSCIVSWISLGSSNGLEDKQ